MSTALLSLSTLFLSNPLYAQALTPQAAIKSQAGCYEVTFQYHETASLIDGYELAKPKRSQVIEWIVVEEDTPTSISLQHVLVSGLAMIKHWRQVWKWENTELYHYQGNNTWAYNKYAAEEVKGQWSQIVYNVDDSPRYECSASWNNSETDNSWSCTTGAPLPRREQKRKDYSLLERTNIHRLTDNGWVHEQLNTKVKLQAGQRKGIAKEKGYNTYVKIPDKNCTKAINWWPKRRATWQTIQKAWDDFRKDKDQLTFKNSRFGMPLWVRLFWLAKKPVNTPKKQKKVYKKASKLIQSYSR